MNAVRGAVGVGIIALAFWLGPADRDPIMMSLPWKFQLLIILALTAMMLAGTIVFFWGVVADEPWKNMKADDASAQPPAHRGDAAL